MVPIPRKLASKIDVQIVFLYLTGNLGRVLRYLATNHFFKEVSPDVFANNRVSSVLDTGKSFTAIQAE